MRELLAIYAPGNLDMADSYGLIACQLARYIEAAGVAVQAMAIGERCVDGQPEDIRSIVSRPVQATMGGIVLGYPTMYHQYGPLSNCGPRVAITMFESTKLPSGWVAELNRCAAVVTPSSFCADVFVRCGVNAPVHVIPLGIGESFAPHHRHRGSMYTFVAIADRGLRKGAHIAAQAFVRAFEDDPTYRLVLKSRVKEEVTHITNSNIDLIQVDMSEAELADFYRSADCMVFPSCGEGFGLPPREFAATGGPVIATAWSGTDNVGDWGLPLGYRLVPAWPGHPIFEQQQLGEWAEPDVDELAVLMREVADEADTYNEWAYHNAKTVAKQCSWAHFARGVLDVWSDVLRETYGDRSAAISVTA
jgi:glycosyltransferase involved in cell wall biosynthesis